MLPTMARVVCGWLVLYMMFINVRMRQRKGDAVRDEPRLYAKSSSLAASLVFLVMYWPLSSRHDAGRRLP